MSQPRVHAHLDCFFVRCIYRPAKRVGVPPMACNRSRVKDCAKSPHRIVNSTNDSSCAKPSDVVSGKENEHEHEQEHRRH